MDGGQNRRILVIDDEQIIRELLMEIFSTQGYEVLLAASGEEGLKRYAARPAGLVLVDYTLKSALDGLEVCRRLHALGAPNIVLMTGHGQLDEVAGEKCIRLVISKPFNMSEVLNIASECLGS